MLYHVLKKNIGTSIYSNILYKHNIVLSMYCILLLYNLPQIRKQYSTHLTTVPEIFVLILVISQRVAIFSNILLAKTLAEADRVVSKWTVFRKWPCRDGFGGTRW